MSKRGHSNIYADRAEPHPRRSDVAMIPLSGGATPYTVRDLPTLSLSRAEWQEIGERMGWAKYQLSADREAREGKRAHAD